MITLHDNDAALPNRLWQARHRRGLGQKRVATLLNYKKLEQLSRFEQGTRLPSLAHALALEIIYGVPVRVLFYGLYQELQRDLRDKTQQPLRPVVSEMFERADTKAGLELCVYEEMLRSALLTPLERQQVRDHVTRLAQQLASL